MKKDRAIPTAPLAERVRPKTLDEFQGQKSLIAPGKPLRSMIDNDSLTSFIMWGPPGVGKTTLARIIADKTQSEFFQINAVSSGVKEVREIIEIARNNFQSYRKTVLFIDEIHRFNKSQQDALLSSVESGLIILIGATTENPSFEVIPALRSRVRIFTLEELSEGDLSGIVEHALKTDEFLSSFNIESVDTKFLIYISGGDARIMLNVLEAAVLNEMGKETIALTKEVIENAAQTKNILYDKGGEEHYNVISAFIKSMRGSDPDAALYWMARMIEGGEDPLFIARRMIVFASEDIGNASPNALLLANATFDAVNKIGMPEGRIPLAQCVTYLASSPKSNASYMALEKAFEDVINKTLFPVPLHLRNAPTKLMKELGYHGGYKYPHDFPGHFIMENYLPDEITNSQYYYPTEHGNEKTLKERLMKLWEGKKKY
ncbi:MAG TPA: replication-associated recombination protein A [Ignavibacteriales bacterium]|nr:replication-associated recombination protein A [Ignavibacteriales bacterium]